MISVLIPVYNQKITKLVKTLLDQSRKYDIIIEVIALDDRSKASIRKHNSRLLHAFNVNYVELSENIGRSKIRNWLVKLARYDHVLFLDCDSEIKDKAFLKKYKNYIPTTVVYGGRKYQKNAPRTPKKMLHWKYGREIESKSAKERSSAPYLHFMSNNFLASKDLMKTHPFNEKIKGYGYEDLIWARSLEKSQIKIHHIDNPVIHKGIETTEVFLEKTLNAIKNLDEAYENGWIGETRLIKTAKWLKTLKLIPLFNWWYDRNDGKILKNLKSNHPTMSNFSIWKLRKLIEVT